MRGDIAVAKGKDMDSGQRSPPFDSFIKNPIANSCRETQNTDWSRSGSTTDGSYNYYNNTLEEIVA